jgi:signal transduction histidine kinase
MNIRSYIWDKKRFLLLYGLLMLFVSSVYYFNIPADTVWNEILYINTVSFVLLLTYILAGYSLKARYYKKLKAILRTSQDNLLNALPKAYSFEQRVYRELLQKLYQQQNEKMEKLYREKKENLEFITSWVHEIKTPISVSRLVIENSRDKPAEEVLGSLGEELDKIEAQVEQVLYNSRADEFAKDYMISEVPLEEVARAVVKKHAATFIHKKISVEISDMGLEVISDRKWVFYILDQIIINSLKYTAPGGRIHIASREIQKEKQLIIEDNGIGILPEDVGRVFERGFTGHNGRTEQKSTGMGLYLARRLARKLGHEISVESEVGAFTRVTLHFPKLKDYYRFTS